MIVPTDALGAVAFDAQGLRRAFDAHFASPPAAETEAREDLLAIRLAERPFALRLRELSGLRARLALTRIPSRAPDLLGVAGIDGRIVPVFSLAMALGLEGSDDDARWVALAGGGAIGLAFPEMERFLKVPSSSIRTQADAGNAALPESVLCDGVARGLVRLAAVIALLKTRAGLPA